MERVHTRPSNTLLVAVTAVTSFAVGALLVEGSRLGRGWEASVAVLAVLAVAAAWWDERLGLACFVLSFASIVDPDFRVHVGSLWVPLPALMAGLLCARELVRRWQEDTSFFAAVPLVPLGVLLGGFLLSGFAVRDPSAYASELVKWSAHIFVFVTMILVLRRPVWIFAVLDGLSLVIAGLAVFGLYRVFQGYSYYVDIFAGIATRNAGGLYMTAVLPVVYASIIGTSGVNRAARLGLFAVLLTGLVFTYTRAAWIATTLGFLFVAGRRPRDYAFVALAIAALVLLVPPEVRERFQTIFVAVDYGSGSPLASSTIGREYLLRTGLAMVRGHWLLGVGLGNYLDNYAQYVVPGCVPFPTLPHNSYVLLWAEGGVVSLLGFFWLYGGQLRAVWLAHRACTGRERLVLRGLLGTLLALAVESALSNDLNIIIMWTLLGIASALAADARRTAL